MKVNVAIKAVMKESGFKHSMMAQILGMKTTANVAVRLSSENLQTDKIIEMLEPMGYELIIQKKLPGTRPRDQIVIERSEKK